MAMGLKTARSSSHHNGKDRCHGQPTFAYGMHRDVILHLWTSSSRKIFYVCAPIYGPINLKEARAPMRPSLSIHHCCKSPVLLSFAPTFRPALGRLPLDLFDGGLAIFFKGRTEGHSRINCDTRRGVNVAPGVAAY